MAYHLGPDTPAPGRPGECSSVQRQKMSERTAHLQVNTHYFGVQRSHGGVVVGLGRGMAGNLKFLYHILLSLATLISK